MTMSVKNHPAAVVMQYLNDLIGIGQTFSSFDRLPVWGVMDQNDPKSIDGLFQTGGESATLVFTHLAGSQKWRGRGGGIETNQCDRSPAPQYRKVVPGRPGMEIGLP